MTNHSKTLDREDVKKLNNGHRQRVRTRLLESKKGTMPDFEILEIILFSASPRKDVRPLAKKLINDFGSLAKVLNASKSELLNISGVNESVIANIRAIQEASERLLKEDMMAKPILQSWKSLIDYCRASMGHLKNEQFRILFLDSKNRLIADDLQETGTVNQTPVYPREVVKRALEVTASSLILVHNHPSGDVNPSRADILLTKQIVKALESIDIKLHDHLIVGSKGHYSFKSNGII